MASLAKALRDFGEQLKPSEALLQRGQAQLRTLIRCIEARTRFPLKRWAMAGSVGKHTAILLKIDFDVLFFLEECPHQGFLQDLDEILTLNFGIDARVRERSISFEFKGFQFDFLPAPLLGGSPEAQVRGALKCADAEGKDPSDLGVAEGTVAFMQEASGFAHTLARILKFWSHSLLIPGFFNGRSYTMELVAVLALREMSDEDALRAFRLALVKLRDFRSVHATFQRFYSHGEIPSEVLKQRPLLLDPTSPVNNLMEPGRIKFFQQMSAFAGETLTRLEMAEKLGAWNAEEIFRPQPPVWKALPVRPKRESWLVGNQALPDAAQPTADVRVAARAPEMLLISHVFGLVLHCANVGSDIQASRARITKAVDRIIYGEGLPWTSSSQTFDGKNVVLIVPLNTPDAQCVLAGFDIEETPVKERVALDTSFDPVHSERWPPRKRRHRDPCEVMLRPCEILFTQDGFSRNFKDGTPVLRTVRQIAERQLQKRDVEIIEVQRVAGRYYSLSNRRLAAYRLLSFLAEEAGGSLGNFHGKIKARVVEKDREFKWKSDSTTEGRVGKMRKTDFHVGQTRDSTSPELFQLLGKGVDDVIPDTSTTDDIEMTSMEEEDSDAEAP